MTLLTNIGSKFLLNTCLIIASIMAIIAISGCDKMVVMKTPDHLQRLVNETLIDGVLSSDASIAVTLRSRALSIWQVATGKLLQQWSDDDFDETNYLVALSANKH